MLQLGNIAIYKHTYIKGGNYLPSETSKPEWWNTIGKHLTMQPGD